MATNQTPTAPDALLSLPERVKENYWEPPLSRPKRGKKREFSGLSFLLLAVVAVTTRTFRDSELRKFLEQDQKVRQFCGFQRVPHRTSIGRRLAGAELESGRIDIASDNGNYVLMTLTVACRRVFGFSRITISIS